MTTLSVLAIFLVALTMGLAIAHALEFPGKLRLDEPTCRAVQEIYYPGFTIGGLVGEFGGMLVLGVHLMLTPMDSKPFWWTAASLGLLIIGHAIYWILTHPVNKAWLKDTNLKGISKWFFGMFSSPGADWKHMRNVWEYSHVARACLATLSFMAMTFALIQRG